MDFMIRDQDGIIYNNYELKGIWSTLLRDN